MIVKNEERVLGRCLACAAQIADELIVVDTGSTDRSAEIARQYTPHVYLHQWQDSFAEARNYSYSLATCDYIMWLDADDVIDEENLSKFNDLKKRCLAGVDVIFTIYNMFTEDGITNYTLRDRIIRRSLDAKWEYDIHEGIPMQPECKYLYRTDITIQHKKEYVNDPGRNMEIFNKILRDAKPMSDFEKSNYCKELSLAGRDEEAYRVFSEIKPTASSSTYYYAMNFLVTSLLRLKRYDDCIREISESEERFPMTAYLKYIQGICYSALGRNSDAKECWLCAMTIPEDPTTLFIQNTGYTDYFPMLRLAELAAMERDSGKASEYVERAAALYPEHHAWRDTRITVLLLT